MANSGVRPITALVVGTLNGRGSVRFIAGGKDGNRNAAGFLILQMLVEGPPPSLIGHPVMQSTGQVIGSPP